MVGGGNRRSLGGRAEAVPEGIDLEIVDIGSLRVVDAIAGHQPDVVVHAAAQVSVARSMADPDGDFRINVNGTKLVLEGARRSGARIVFLSSGGAIYGESDGADEASLPAPKSYYGVHKYLAERYIELSGLGFAIARLSNVYSPGQRSDLEGGVIAIFAESLQSNGRITIDGTGDQRRDFVHVSDVTRALVRLAQHDGVGTWNVASGESVSIRGLLRILEAEFGAADQVAQGPARSGDVFNSRLRIDRIGADVGWKPAISLDAGIRDLRNPRSATA